MILIMVMMMIMMMMIMMIMMIMMMRRTKQLEANTVSITWILNDDDEDHTDRVTMASSYRPYLLVIPFTPTRSSARDKGLETDRLVG
jgi:hypothetical protein